MQAPASRCTTSICTCWAGECSAGRPGRGQGTATARLIPSICDESAAELCIPDRQQREYTRQIPLRAAASRRFFYSTLRYELRFKSGSSRGLHGQPWSAFIRYEKVITGGSTSLYDALDAAAYPAITRPMHLPAGREISRQIAFCRAIVGNVTEIDGPKGAFARGF